MKTTSSALLLIAVSLVALCLSSCNASRHNSNDAHDTVTLTIGLPFRSGDDPLRGMRQAARLASVEGLTTQTTSGRAAARLADSWEESPDGLSWKINLRHSAVFHDGSAVDAKAVKASIEQSLKSRESQFSPGLQDISSIEATDPFVLTIRLKQRSTFLLDDLDIAITKTDAKGAQVGTGPYVVSASSPDEVEMTSFPRYYRGKPAIDRLVWRAYPTVRTAWAATMRGQADFLYEVGPETREFFESETSIALYPFLRAYVYGVVFNAHRPIFKNAELRRALNYAVNRTAIVERAFRGHGIPASGPAWPLHWAYDASIPGYSYDPARAAASLEKALRGDSGTPRTDLKFVCLIPENFQLWEKLALMVQRNLAEIGVSMALETLPAEEFTRRIGEGQFDAVLTELVSGTTVSRPFFSWKSSGPSNFAGYQNPNLDSALEDIRRAENDEAYRDAFRRFQQATVDDPPAIFLAWGETARAVRRRFDVVKGPAGDIRMTISDWRLSGHSDQASN